jgi:hypothetical protein
MFNSDRTEVYVVGGAVRNVLLGIQPKDIDYVVINGSHDEMIELGFTMVGADFPVYLSPDTNEEYAFARLERKVGVGYTGFECFVEGVTLLEDLARRDLTINSMAVSLHDWDIFRNTGDRSLVIDPYNGLVDLSNKQIKHTSAAFTEDPLRVMRAARFASTFGFVIHPDTLQLMTTTSPSISDISMERIWTELVKGIMGSAPDVMMDILSEVGVFDVVKIKPLSGYHGFGLSRLLDTDSLDIRFALIGLNVAEDEYDALCIPNAIARISMIFNEFATMVLSYTSSSAAIRYKFLNACGVRHTDKILLNVLRVIQIVAPFRYERHAPFIMDDVQKLKSLDLTSAASQCPSGMTISTYIKGLIERELT